jgi:hypothetical protein
MRSRIASRVSPSTIMTTPGPAARPVQNLHHSLGVELFNDAHLIRDEPSRGDLRESFRSVMRDRIQHVVIPTHRSTFTGSQVEKRQVDATASTVARGF